MIMFGSISSLFALKETLEVLKKDFNATVNECLKNEDPQIGVTLWECVASDEGNQLQHEIADFTAGLNPPHNHVPWVIVDGKYDAQTEDSIINDMLGYLCERTDTPIAACRQQKFLKALFENKSKCYKNWIPNLNLFYKKMGNRKTGNYSDFSSTSWSFDNSS